MTVAICGQLAGGFGTLLFMVLWLPVTMLLVPTERSPEFFGLVWIGGGVVFLIPLAFYISPWICS